MGWSKRVILAGALALSGQPALAWDGYNSGKITGLDVVADGQNFGLRVYMNGTPMCGTAYTWAFMNKSTSNYDATVAVLTSAYMAGKPVIIHTMKNGEYCEIGYVMLR